MVVAHLHPYLPWGREAAVGHGDTRDTGMSPWWWLTSLLTSPGQRRRYETYVQVLETWISAGARDLEGWEAQAGPAVAPPDPPTLTKAHSSPSLAAEPPLAPTIRVKRNISERRTVRKIVPKRNKNLL